MRRFRLVYGLSVLALLPFPAGAQQTPAAQRLQWFDQHLAARDRSPFKSMRWQFLGPTNISGRMTDVAIVTPKGQNYTIFGAGATGGLWRSNNEGTTWEPALENIVTASTGDVTLAPSNQNILWVGTGEANIFRSSNAGAGVWKSTDQGRTFQHMGLAGTSTIPRIVIHPTNPDIVYVAATGNEWTPNPDRGVFKTTNGGRTWEKVLFISDNTGVVDLVMDPADPNTLYASSWQRVRRKWNDPRVEPGYDQSGVYKSTDGGRNWKQINTGLPAAQHRGRIGLDIARSNPRVLYAFVDNYEIARPAAAGEMNAYGLQAAPVIKGATVYRSDDRGESWHQTSPADRFMEGLAGTYGWVFAQLRVDPTNENKIYVMGLALNVSEDGGKTWRTLRGMHGDHHGLWIDPANPNYLANVHDGGISISYDGRNFWNFTENLPLVQFFNVAADMAQPFHVYGSIQDHGSRRAIVDLSRGRNSIPAQAWENAPGGEGTHHAVDPRDPDVVYSTSFYGRISRTNPTTGESVELTPKPKAGEMPLRMQWLTPFILSPHNPSVLYHGSQFLHRSTDRGETWERISPDLTYNDPAKYGDIPYQTIFSIAESPFTFGQLYAGTDDGRLWVTADGGRNWTEIGQSMPRGKFVAEIVASAYDPATVYVVLNGKRDDDHTPYIFKSTDYGKSFTSITNNLTSGPVNVIKEDPKNRNVLYAGTDHAAFVSIDGGRSWQALGTGPTVYVHDLVVHPRDDILVIATHGRGMFAMDVRPIQQLTPDIMAQPVAVLSAEPGRLGRGGFGGGGNTPAYVPYWLKSAGAATITIRDSNGNVLRQFTGPGEAGLNFASWDLNRLPTADGATRNNAVQTGVYNVEVKQGTAVANGMISVSR